MNTEESKRATMFDWVETCPWKAFKDIATLLMGIAVLFLGKMIFVTINVQEREIQAQNATVGHLRAEIRSKLGTSGTPVTEPGPIIDDAVLGRHNISLADYPDQIPVVQQWLTNPYSGYPALVDAIGRVLGSNRLAGNSVPLTIISARNLRAHGRATNNPIIASNEINDSHLREAIYTSWAEKNAGSVSTHKSFTDILVPIP